MSDSKLVAAVVERLSRVGYQQIETPFKVASVEFNFSAALKGRDGRSTDLILVIDTSIDNPSGKLGDQIKQRLEALGRALDVMKSRFVVTTVLAGAVWPPQTIEAIGKSSRVLVVSVDPDAAPEKDKALVERDFDDSLRVLLPLQIGNETAILADPLNEVKKELSNSKLLEMVQPYLDCAIKGDIAVSEMLNNDLDAILSRGLNR